jgi:Fic family protein
MKLESFKSGEYKQQYQYQSFSPTLINHGWSWDDGRVNTLLEQATKALGELNAFSLIVPDVDLFIEMHIVKEANQSSRIEGTQTQMDEAVMDIDQIAPERRDDWQEVQNYIQAMNQAIADLKSLPLSTRLIRQTHEILMSGVRGEHKTPGEFRVSQNWIGGSCLQDAVFIPPHHDEVAEFMSDLEKFLHNDEIEVPHLIRVAIAHYQFETTHPFLDGNGRIGRLIITLYLIEHGMLTKPSLYLSDFIEKHKGAYYDALTRVRASNDLLHWVRFFLNAIVETAKQGCETFQAILALRHQVEGKIVTLGRRAENGRHLLMHLYKKPVITGTQVAALLDVTPRAANGLIQELVTLGILNETTGYKRNRVFTFQAYLELF